MALTIQSIKKYNFYTSLNGRVCRVWIPKLNEQTGSFNCLLVDCKGNAIQASAKGKNIQPFSASIIEGNYYQISGFYTFENRYTNSVVTHEAIIDLKSDTKVTRLDPLTPPVPRHYFNFIDFAHMLTTGKRSGNSAPMPNVNRTGGQAVAMRISGDKAAFHNCKFIGFQDTLCDDRGRHFFKDCYVRGTVDFIFGNGKSLYLNTTIDSVAQGTGVITAQAREHVTEDSGFTFIHCNLTGLGNNTYLGRAWKQRPRVVFAYTYMGHLINDEGWSTWKYPERKGTVYYGEYKCSGPGSNSSYLFQTWILIVTCRVYFQ